MEYFITVTVVSATLKEEVQKELLKLNSEYDVLDNKKDSLGRTAEFYEDLGIPIPEELQSDNEPEIFEVKKEHYNIIEKKGRVRPSIIDFIVENDDSGCILYTNTDFTITVKESVEEIENKIKFIKDGVK